MPPQRRISNVPLLATAEEQKALLAFLDDKPDIADAIAVHTGKSFHELNNQEKLSALRGYQKSGMSLAPLVKTARLARQLIEEANLVLEGETQTQVELLQAELAAARLEISKIRKKNKKLRRQIAASKSGQGVQ